MLNWQYILIQQTLNAFLFHLFASEFLYMLNTWPILCIGNDRANKTMHTHTGQNRHLVSKVHRNCFVYLVKHLLGGCPVYKKNNAGLAGGGGGGGEGLGRGVPRGTQWRQFVLPRWGVSLSDGKLWVSVARVCVRVCDQVYSSRSRL